MGGFPQCPAEAGPALGGFFFFLFIQPAPKFQYANNSVKNGFGRWRQLGLGRFPAYSQALNMANERLQRFDHIGVPKGGIVPVDADNGEFYVLKDIGMYVF